jgi:hypothetical protein
MECTHCKRVVVICDFALGGAVDDSFGILFTDGSLVDMDGLYKIKRLGGNAYYYQTYP